MKRFVIYHQSKLDPNNCGYVFRNHKIGFSAVMMPNRARKFKTVAEAQVMLANIESREGSWYTFDIKEIEV